MEYLVLFSCMVLVVLVLVVTAFIPWCVRNIDILIEQIGLARNDIVYLQYKCRFVDCTDHDRRCDKVFDGIEGSYLQTR